MHQPGRNERGMSLHASRRPELACLRALTINVEVLRLDSNLATCLDDFFVRPTNLLRPQELLNLQGRLDRSIELDPGGHDGLGHGCECGDVGWEVDDAFKG